MSWGCEMTAGGTGGEGEHIGPAGCRRLATSSSLRVVCVDTTGVDGGSTGERGGTALGMGLPWGVGMMAADNREATRSGVARWEGILTNT